MQTQDPFSLPFRAEHVSSSPEAARMPVSPAKGIAVEQLKMANDSDEPADLHSKSITTPPGTWASIKKFFERRFSEIKEADKQKGQEINLLIGKVERDLDKITTLAKRAAHTERTFKGKFPTDESVETSRESLDESRKLLAQAQDHLADLRDEEAEAERLADMHSTYDALPAQILALENNIQYLETRLQVAEKLLELEEVIKDYQPEESWDQFVKAAEQRKELAQALRDIVTDNPVLENDPTVQKYIDKEHWNAYDVYQLMKTTFPGLKGQVERLFDNTVEMQKNRIQRLEKQVDDLKPLFSKYAQQSKYISNLEKSIYDNSIFGRIYRIFYGKKYLKGQLEQVIREQKETYQSIKEKTQFNQDELDWLKKIATTTHPEKMDLRQDIEALQKGKGYLKVRQKLSNQMSKLLKHLEFYRKHHLHLQDKLDNDFIDYTKLEAAIQKDIQDLAGNVKNWSYKQGALPANFTKMDVIDQLKTVISSSFPTLGKRSFLLFQLIDGLELHDDLNQAIIEGTPFATELTDEEPIETEAEESFLISEEESDTLVDTVDTDDDTDSLDLSYETIVTPSSSISIENEEAAISVEEDTDTEEEIFDEEEVTPETNTTEPEPQPIPPAPPLLSLKDLVKPKENKTEYKKVEVEQPEADDAKKKVDPSKLLDDIKKGTTLQHVEPEEKKPVPKSGLLADIAKGVSLNKVEVEEKKTVVIVVDYAKKIENGEMRIEDVPEEFKQNLGDILLLQMASMRKSTKDEEANTKDDEEWED